MSLGEKIRTLLEQRGMEQQDFAKKVGVAPSSVSEWVRGETHPRYKRLAKIAQVLKVPLAELTA